MLLSAGSCIGGGDGILCAYFTLRSPFSKLELEVVHGDGYTPLPTWIGDNAVSAAACTTQIGTLHLLSIMMKPHICAATCYSLPELQGPEMGTSTCL